MIDSDWLLMIIGLIALVVGGEMMVRGAVRLAERFQMSPMVIGITVVGFGTSAPELVTSIQAALSGSPGVAVGNVVGSNISNVLLILGTAACITPVVVTQDTFRRDVVVLVIVSMAVATLIGFNVLQRHIGAALFLGLMIYLMLTLLAEQRQSTIVRQVLETNVQIKHPIESERVNLIWTVVLKVKLHLTDSRQRLLLGNSRDQEHRLRCQPVRLD
jgi:cation:H+ antiporter